MSLAISFVLVAFFLAMNAFFVVAEFSLVRVRPSQLEIALDEKKRGAQAAKEISDNVNAYLSACQLGITLASLALGWLGEPAFSELIRPLCNLFGLPDAVVSAISVAIGYFLMTTFHVVVGELIPKSFAIFSTERFALATAGPLIGFYRVTYPIMVLFNGITNAVVRLAGHDPTNEHEVYAAEEIQLLIDESTESGLVSAEQNTYVDNIFDLGDKDAATIMTPRTDVICLDLDDSLQENLETALLYKYTRYPVCRGSKDRIIGFVHVKDLYTMPPDASMDDLPIHELIGVSENIQVARLLQTLQQEKTKMAIVVDEHGGTAGVVTMSDIMEQIVGRIDDEFSHGNAEEARIQADGSYIVEGLLAVDDLIDLMGFEPAEAEECETAGGMLLDVFDRIPAVGDVAQLTDGKGCTVTFVIEQMDRLRIDTFRMTIEREESEEDKEA